MLDILQRTVYLSNLCETYWAEIDSLRKQIVQAVVDPNTDTASIAPYVTTANRLSRLASPDLLELKSQIAAKQQQLFADRQEQIYQAQLVLQEADEKLAALMSDDELVQLQMQLEQKVAEQAESAPQLTRSLVMRRGARQAITSMLEADNNGIH